MTQTVSLSTPDFQSEYIDIHCAKRVRKHLADSFLLEEK